MKKISVLIVGSGGREHALGWKISRSPFLKKLYFAPGNGGTQEIGTNIPISQKEIKKLLSFTKEKKIDLTIIGPEDPLALGIVDLFYQHNLLIFGPTKKAARLESSKSFAINFMKKHQIPHPSSWIFDDLKEAISFIKSSRLKHFVIKADGLVLGKGVFICKNKKEAKMTVEKLMIKKIMGEAGKKIVIQEELTGEEISFLVISDGKTFLSFLPSQDHKRVFDNDRGPNTGGMGAYAPVPFINKKLITTIENKIIKPTIVGMRKQKTPFVGVLYAGLMIVNRQPYVLEFNVRFGDPETQPLMMLLKSDLLPILYQAAKKNLINLKLKFKKGAAITVVLAAKGYPGKYRKEVPINLDYQSLSQHAQIFHAGTVLENDQLLTNGGRVISVTLFDKKLPLAFKKIYRFIKQKKVFFKGMHYRTDIGKRALKYFY